MNILSLFGGAEQGRAVLQEMGIIPTNYFSSEIDPYAIKLSSDNFPDIKHLGCITGVHYQPTPWGYGFCREHDMTRCDKIDFLIGGPPCQDLSIAGKRAGLDGARSSLFYEYVRILNETKPKIFFMENVASMPKEARDTITKTLFGIEPMRIDSRLTSAQTRKRLYWFGVRQPDGTYKGIDIPQPKDAGILLKDILEDIPFDALDKKGEPIWKPVPEKYISIIEKRLDQEKCLAINANYAKASIANVKKSGHQIIVRIPEATKKGFVELQEGDCVDMQHPGSKTRRGRLMREKLNASYCGSQFMTIGRLQIPHENNTGGLYPLNKTCAVNAHGDYANNNKLVSNCIENVDGEWEYVFYWRKLTVRECARAQSFPESYSFDSVSASRGYKACGNSWEGKAVKHMWEYLLKYL